MVMAGNAWVAPPRLPRSSELPFPFSRVCFVSGIQRQHRGASLGSSAWPNLLSLRHHAVCRNTDKTTDCEHQTLPEQRRDAIKWEVENASRIPKDSWSCSPAIKRAKHTHNKTRFCPEFPSRTRLFPYTKVADFLLSFEKICGVLKCIITKICRDNLKKNLIDLIYSVIDIFFCKLRVHTKSCLLLTKSTTRKLSSIPEYELFEAPTVRI